MSRCSVPDGGIRHRSSLADHPDVGELLPAFVGRLPGYVKALREQAAAADGEGLRRTVHQLRGAGKTYGFAPLSHLAGAVEDLLHEGRPVEEVGGTLEALVDYLERVEGYPG